jgi:hypothetical protein
VATSYSRKDIGSGRSGASLKSVAAVLVVYTALYLAVVGVIHFMSSPDASAAIAPDIATAHVEATAAPVAPSAGNGESPATHQPDPAMGGTDNSPECTTAIDAECIYN